MSDKTPLYNAIIKQKEHISFHTPGHKFKMKELNALFGCDTTEISSTDELYEPTGPVLEAEKLAAEICGSPVVVFSAGGATLCIQTAMSFFSGKKILCERNCHYSVLNAASLLDIDIDFISPDINEDFGIIAPPKARPIRDLLSQSDYSALFITSPDYFGQCRDLKLLRKICDEYGISLIIDASHGSHLSFMYDDSRNANRYGDFVIDSLHKTLPVLTGGAVLCVKGGHTREEVKSRMKIFASSSPSFPILASIDLGLNYINDNVDKYLKCAEKVALLSSRLIKYGYSILRPRSKEPLRICIDTFSIGYPAEKIEEILNEHDIYSEVAKNNILIFLFSPMNDESDIGRLADVLLSIKKKKPLKNDLGEKYYSLPEKRKTLTEAFFSERETIPVEKAEGRLSACTISTCPPGMPIVAAGEVIEKKHIQILSEISSKIEVIK